MAMGGVLLLIVHFICHMTWSADLVAGGFVLLIDTVIDEFIAVLIVAEAIYRGIRGHRANRLFSALGGASLVIYLLHTYIVTAIKFVAIRLGLCSSLWMDIVVLVISSVSPISICYFVDWIRRKNILVGVIFAPGKRLKIFG